jgi:hypothetical protein
LTAWSRGEEVRGWARYWDMVHVHLARILDFDSRVRDAALVVRFDDLCDAPAKTIRSVLNHCALPDVKPILSKYAETIRRPDYYASSFSPSDLAAIREETDRTASGWGY